MIKQILTEADEIEVNESLAPLVAEQQASILERLRDFMSFNPAALEAAREKLAGIAEDVDREVFRDHEKSAQ